MELTRLVELAASNLAPKEQHDPQHTDRNDDDFHASGKSMVLGIRGIPPNDCVGSEDGHEN